MKNLKAIILLFVANSISGFSQGVSILAIPWYFTDNLEQPGLYGKIYFAVTIVSLFWGLYVGTMIDKYPRKNLFLAENIFGAIVFIGTGLLGYAWGGIPLIWVVLAFASTFFIYNVHYPTLYAFAQELIEPEYYGKISSWLEIQGQLTSVASGAIAAMLLSGVKANSFIPFDIEAWSLHRIFLIDGCTYAVSFLIIAAIQYQPAVQRKIETGSIVKRLKSGIHFLRANPLLFIFGNAAYFVFVTIMVFNFMVLPNYVRNDLGGSGNVFATAEIFYSLGALGAGFSIHFLFKKTYLTTGNILLSLLAAIVFFIGFFNTSYWVLYLILFFLALANSGSRILRVTDLFRTIPNNVIGRTQSVFKVINVLFRIIFIGLFSIAFFITNTQYVFMTFAIFLLIAAGILYYFRKGLIGIEKGDTLIDTSTSLSVPE